MSSGFSKKRKRKKKRNYIILTEIIFSPFAVIAQFCNTKMKLSTRVHDSPLFQENVIYCRRIVGYYSMKFLLQASY